MSVAGAIEHRGTVLLYELSSVCIHKWKRHWQGFDNPELFMIHICCGRQICFPSIVSMSWSNAKCPATPAVGSSPLKPKRFFYKLKTGWCLWLLRAELCFGLWNKCKFSTWVLNSAWAESEPCPCGVLWSQLLVQCQYMNMCRSLQTSPVWPSGFVEASLVPSKCDRAQEMFIGWRLYWKASIKQVILCQRQTMVPVCFLPLLFLLS